MKKYVFTILFIYLCTSVKAQLYVQSGATLHVGGIVTLHYEDFIRSPVTGTVISFEPGSNVLFTGDADNVVSGYISFLNLEIAKEGTHKVSLQNYNEEVKGQMVFTSGLFDLNNNTLLLGNTGTLINENENSHIIGPGGGMVQVNSNLNQPNNANPGNIGATITSTKNLGDVTIQRGYLYPFGFPPNSIKRYYSINFVDPGLDNNLDATMRLNYFDAELNGTDETKLVHWKYDNTTSTWLQQGSAVNTIRNTSENWVQLTGIPSLSTWTLAESLNALPVTFSSFEVNCRNNKPFVNWQTSSEINTDHFEIQRSNNGITWTTIAIQTAAGQSNALRNYSYTDATTINSGKFYYRIVSVDVGGQKKYTGIKVSACAGNEKWLVWPNPVHEELNVSLQVSGRYKAMVQLIDNKGAVVLQQLEDLVPGSNWFIINMSGKTNGVYHLAVSWSEGRRNIKILKN